MDKLLTTQELAEKLSVPITWIYSRTSNGQLPTIKLGRYCMFREKDVEDFIEKMKGA